MWVAELAGLRDADRVGVLPAQATTLHVALGGDDVCAGLVEYPVIRVRSGPRLAAGRAEAVEHPQLVERAEAKRRSAQPSEVQPHELFGRQDAVVVAVERDLPVAVCQPRAEGREMGGRDLARPCGGGSVLCVHMRSRSGWRAIAMNKGAIEGVRGTRIER